MTQTARIVLMVVVCATALLASTLPSRAADATFEDRLREAIRLHDAGDYDGAIALYRDLLKESPENSRVLYEIAYSSLQAGRFDDATDYAERALKAHSDFDNQTYQVLGSAHDGRGDFKAGEKVLRRGLKKFPQDYLLHFNLGVNLAKQKRMDDAIPEFEEGLVLKPDHASGWRGLGFACEGLGQRGYAFVAFARFLTLEPESSRSREAAPKLWSLLFQGVKSKETAGSGSKGDVDITLPAPGKGGGNDAAMNQSVGLSILAATRFIDEWKDKSDAAFFAHAFDEVLSILSETGDNAKTKDQFWRSRAFPYFNDARGAGHLEAMAYDLRRTLGDDETRKWLEEHRNAVDRFRDWSKSWKPAEGFPAGS